MLAEGRKRGISIFGVGDHNHNLDISKWRRIKRESGRLGNRDRNLVVMANCEITFLLGHLLVLQPSRITGTIREGYDYLYRNRSRIKILAHPNPDTDEWHRRFVPDATGIEVVNGAVLRQAREKGWFVTAILGIPMVRLYARYLGLGYAVAAIGNSDAHALSEMGSGLTGISLSTPLSVKNVLTAIRRRETFATTDPGIRLNWSMKNSTFSWHVDWSPEDPLIAKKHAIEIYCGERKVRTAGPTGSMELQKDKLYWLSAFNASAYAVSSPIRCEESRDTPRSGRRSIPPELLEKPLRDLAFQQLRRSPKLDISPTKRRGSVTIELLSKGAEPLIVDAKGKPVPYEVLEPARERVVIDKSCISPCFDEFFLWLKRNEIHEYGFLELDYHYEQDLLRLQARIVPAPMVLIRGFRRWHRTDVDRLRSLVTPSTRFQLDVRTLFKSTLSLQLQSHCFPLRLREPEDTSRSLLVWHDDVQIGQAFSHYTAGKKIQLPEFTQRDRIFQIFVSPEESTG